MHKEAFDAGRHVVTGVATGSTLFSIIIGVVVIVGGGLLAAYAKSEPVQEYLSSHSEIKGLIIIILLVVVVFALYMNFR